MRVLFIVLILSLCALLWAAISIAGHIRRHGTRKAAGKGSAEEQSSHEAEQNASN